MYSASLEHKEEHNNVHIYTNSLKTEDQVGLQQIYGLSIHCLNVCSENWNWGTHEKTESQAILNIFQTPQMYCRSLIKC